MEEKFISLNLKASERDLNEALDPVLTHFRTRQRPSKKWIVEFLLNGSTMKLTLKRRNCDGERARMFARLNGVEVWMKKMGVQEFIVHPYFGDSQSDLNHLFK